MSVDRSSKSIIVIIIEAGEEIKEITPNMEKHPRFTGGTASEDGFTEDVQDRQFGNHLNSYCDAVVAVVRGADTIQYLDPARPKASW